jgi:hypothetical protein
VEFEDVTYIWKIVVVVRERLWFVYSEVKMLVYQKVKD